MIQKCVSLSTTEAEIIAMSEGAREVKYVLNVLDSLLDIYRPVPMYCDNQGAIHLATDYVNNSRSKHIEVRNMYIRELIKAKDTEALYTGTDDNTSDIMTKPLALPILHDSPASSPATTHKVVTEKHIADATTSWALKHSHTTTHNEPIHGIAVSRATDGPRLVATASWDHTCKVSDVAEDRVVANLEGHDQGLYAVEFSYIQPNILGTVSSDHTCRLWNIDSGKCVRTLGEADNVGHTDEVNGLSFNRRNGWVATASDDMTSIIWDSETADEVTILKGHKAVVYGVCFQPDGPLVATVSFDWTSKLWDPRQATVVKSLEGHQDDIIGVDMALSGNLLATGSDDSTCCVWDIRNWQPVSVLRDHSGEVKRVAFSPGGNMLATTSGDKSVRVFHMGTFSCLSVLAGHSDHVFDVAWSPGADFLVSASHDKTWRMWEPVGKSMSKLTSP
ncbi:hypothetical protein CYMTET_14608 [Cymbomonas tetramitiformis]|uniref:Guanine nucleotide-binding protein subunit beta-like protein n=1 Tax=Cymbomonas tetramitiformis TaxID=36881 RepID=A0AAE0GH65_9CHLO|nr:hypothetical protein CYMTET_14608 [Cymbomonas tetramitiformis]